MVRNEVNKRCYVGSSNNVEHRMHTHLLLLRRGAHHVEDMQSDFDKFGEESFSFTPLFEVEGESMNHTNLECFMMAVLRTHSKQYGYNYKDNAGTAKYLTREMYRNIRNAFWDTHHVGCEYNEYIRKPYYKRVGVLEKLDIGSLTELQQKCVKACIESRSFKEAAESINLSRDKVYKIIRDLTDEPKEAGDQV